MDYPYTKLTDSYEFFSIINTPMGSGGISGHSSPSFSQPMAPVAPTPPRPLPQEGSQPRVFNPPPISPVAPPPRPTLQEQPRQSRQDRSRPYREKSFPKWHYPKRDRDRVRYYYNTPYYYYNPYYYSYYPYLYDQEKCFCQDTNLLGALQDKMVCGQHGCGVCIDRYLCNQCNPNVQCKRY